MIYIGEGYPKCFDIAYCFRHFDITNNPKEAQFILFPIFYETLYEYTDEEYIERNYSESDIEIARNIFENLITVSGTLKIKIILFYYRDPSERLPIADAIVFRTSLYKSNRNVLEYALPAFIDLKKNIKIEAAPLLEKDILPSVGFRGQSAPLNLTWKTKVRLLVNTGLEKINSKKRIELYYNRGYLARRNALVSIRNCLNVNKDIKLTSWNNISDPLDYKLDFLSNLSSHPYNICASGYGNYSYRLYEVLSAGRIPVFIDTNCVLPFEEFINWKNHVVWVEETDAKKTADILVDFHHSLHPDDFINLQVKNRSLWEKYLSLDGFFSHLNLYLEKILN